MSSLLDQSDESELLPQTQTKIHEWCQRYITLMGAAPEEEEEPTDHQMTALHNRVCVCVCVCWIRRLMLISRYGYLLAGVR